MRDDEIIAAADEHGIAMIFTGTRHFRHYATRKYLINSCAG
jgi:hypothetical protein